MSHQTTTRLLAVAALTLLTASPTTSRAADQPNTAETRIRETLRNTMLQLRTAQNDNAILQTAKGELERKNKDQETQIKQLTKNIADDKDTSEKTIASLTTKLAAQTEENTKLKQDLARIQADLKAATTLAQTKEAERAKLAADLILLNRTLADQKTKNTELYKLGREILLRYEKYGLGEILGAKEPFVGTTRVKLETYVQDFQDKLSDQKNKP